MALPARLLLCCAAASGLLLGLAAAHEEEDEFVWPPDDLVQPLSLVDFDRAVGNGSTCASFAPPAIRHPAPLTAMRAAMLLQVGG